MTHTLLPYQEAGRDFLVTRSHAFLADEPGLGKTVQAIRACDAINAKWILVVCPAVARIHWEREFALESAYSRGVMQYKPKHLPKVNSVVIVSYDFLSMKDSFALAELKTIRWDVLILDEAHYLKNPAAQRTKAIYGKGMDTNFGLSARADRVWRLSGTPAPNHAGELFTHLKHDKIFTGSREDFETEYCNVRQTQWGREILGSKNIPELRQLFAPTLLRRRKKDVLQDLPPLRFTQQAIELGAQARFTINELLAKAGDLTPLTGGDDVLRTLHAANLHMGTARRVLGMLKVSAAAELILSELNGNNRKLVVFAHHKEVISQLLTLTTELNPVSITGDTPGAERARVVDMFQKDLNTRLFIGNIAAAGTAITLTAASDVIFVEASWTPSDNYQAACRCHRIGQNNGVLARFLSVPGTLDQTIQRVLARKANDLSALFG